MFFYSSFAVLSLGFSWFALCLPFLSFFCYFLSRNGVLVFFLCSRFEDTSKQLGNDLGEKWENALFFFWEFGIITIFFLFSFFFFV